MIIRKTKIFVGCYEALPEEIRKKTDKALEFLLFNFHHPSPQIKKLKGFKNIWYGRIDKNYRFTFQIKSDFLIMRRVGSHNEIIEKP